MVGVGRVRREEKGETAVRSGTIRFTICDLLSDSVGRFGILLVSDDLENPIVTI